MILADDLGYSDLSCYGGEIQTPNLDGLAKNGLRFAQFYNSARCCPTRAALLTGLYPHEAGVGMMTADASEKFPGYRGAIQPFTVTLAEVLKSAGYRTAMSGKWHVGNRVSPIERGFDDFYGFTSGYAVDSFDERMMIRLPEGKPKLSYKPGEYFATDAITDHALDFVNEIRKTGQPYFLYLAYQSPYFPVQSRADDAAPYAKTYDGFALFDAIDEMLDLVRISGGGVIVVFHRRRSRRSYARQKRTPRPEHKYFLFSQRLTAGTQFMTEPP